MKAQLSDSELQSARIILDLLEQGEDASALRELAILRDDLYAAIPAKQRIGRGITWVLQRISRLMWSECPADEQLHTLAARLATILRVDEQLVGVPIFLMAEYGIHHPAEVLDFFTRVGQSDNWQVREFAVAGVHKIIPSAPDVVLPWLRGLALSPNPLLRRLAAEGLRPVAENQWLQKQPERSLAILGLLFHESDSYPRTAVGNNLSDLARHNPELILNIVRDLVASRDPNSYWIAYRTCRNLVKNDPARVMDLLGVDEYHYKDRDYAK